MTGPPKPAPRSAVQRTSGPFAGQVRSIPFWGEVLFLSGPRNCGQSWALTVEMQMNRRTALKRRFVFLIVLEFLIKVLVIASGFPIYS